MPPAGSGHRHRQLAQATLEARGREQLAHVRAVAHVLARVLQASSAQRDLVAQLRLHAVQQAERLGGSHALSRGWQLQHLVVAVADAQRLTHEAVRCEILLLEPAYAAIARPRGPRRTRPDHAPRSLAASGELRHAHALPRSRWRRQLGRHFRRRPTRARLAGFRSQASAVRYADREAALGRVDGVGEARVQPEPAVTRRQRRPAVHGPGNCDRARSALHRLELVGHAPARGPRRRGRSPRRRPRRSRKRPRRSRSTSARSPTGLPPPPGRRRPRCRRARGRAAPHALRAAGSSPPSFARDRGRTAERIPEGHAVSGR